MPHSNKCFPTIMGAFLALPILLPLPVRSEEAIRSPEKAEYAYGTDPLQKLDFWPARASSRPAAVVVFVHGGGWKEGDKSSATGPKKVEHLLAQGYALASLDYRLVPAATVEQQASDISQAIAWIRAHADQLGIDPKRLALMGHSAGAHLVSLVGTDPRYLSEAGLSPSDLRGVVELDGAAYDVGRQISEGGSLMRRTYLQAFGTDTVRQQALSPVFHASLPNAQSFLILHIDRTDGRAQSQALAEALAKAGTAVEIHEVPGRGLIGHMEINRTLGDPAKPATKWVDAWLKRTLAP